MTRRMAQGCLQNTNDRAYFYIPFKFVFGPLAVLVLY